MPQCQFPVFCCFCVSEKLHRKYSQNWTKQKLNVQILNEASRTPKQKIGKQSSPLKKKKAIGSINKQEKSNRVPGADRRPDGGTGTSERSSAAR
jgi:hypothetical protein